MPIAPVIRYGSYSRAAKIRQREPLTLNFLDAHARGIVAGDVVKVLNGRGAFLACVILADGIRPGVVQIATGAWFDPWVAGQPGGLDKHGNPNRVTADIGASLLAQGAVRRPCWWRLSNGLRRYRRLVPLNTRYWSEDRSVQPC